METFKGSLETAVVLGLADPSVLDSVPQAARTVDRLSRAMSVIVVFLVNVW
ncbi:hypothetical protein D3C71_2056340 [compost metagenome]